MSRSFATRTLALALGVFLLTSPWLSAQMDGRGSGGRGRFGGGGGRMTGEMLDQMRNMAPQATPATEPPKEEKKPDAKPAESAKPTGPQPITRQRAMDNPGMSRERLVEVRGEVSLNFQEAPWPFVLEEIARISKM